MNSVPVRPVEPAQRGAGVGLVIALLWCAACWALVAVAIDLLV